MRTGCRRMHVISCRSGADPSSMTTDSDRERKEPPVRLAGSDDETRHADDGQTAVLHQDLVQVILHNDDQNTMDHVVRSLVRVFGHSRPLAEKIMIEAHEQGRAIAEVEDENSAQQHRDQLRSCGLVATVEKLR